MMNPLTYVCLAVLCGGVASYYSQRLPAQCQINLSVVNCASDVPVYYIDPKTGLTCVKSNIIPCGSDVNTYSQSEAECLKSCDICQVQQREDIRCRGNFENYFYNTASGKCELTLYGGCWEGFNSFDTEAACNAACPKSFK